MSPTKAQSQAINSNSEYMLVIAGAGSGKTATAIARAERLLKEGVLPTSILFLTFTKKAALELKQRLSEKVGKNIASKVWAGTFHSISHRILSEWGGAIGYDTVNKEITVVTPEETALLIKEIKDNYGYNGSLKSISNAMNVLAHDGIYPQEISLLRIITEYHARLKECNAVDYDLLLLEVKKLFKVCNEALFHYQKRFEHVFVDEYQDTDKIQYCFHEILQPKHLFCVGDSDQAIYSWRGANMQIILDFEKDHKNAEVIKLEDCFRCGNEIVAAANNLISHNKKRIDKKLIGSTSRKGSFEVYSSDSLSEPEKIAYYIAENLAYEDQNEIAVIGRTHRTLENIEKACEKFNLDILRVGKNTKMVESLPEFQFFLCFLRLMVNSSDNIAFLTANNLVFGKNIQDVWTKSNQMGCSWLEAAGEFFKIPEDATLLGFFEACMYKYMPYCDGYNYDIVIEYLKSNSEGLKAVDWLISYQLKDDHSELEDQKNGKVTLITAHASKGLEWDNVLIAGFKDGKFPSKRAINSGDLEEERRLAYVAFTRARERLIVFANTDKPSRFIEETQEI